MSFSHQSERIKIGHSIGVNPIEIIAHHLTYNKPGPKIYIQAGVHGAEAQGNVVIQLLFEYLKKTTFNGKITVVPHANPYSVNTKMGTYTQGRFSSEHGLNWNRNYVDLAKIYSDDIIKQATKADLNDINTLKDSFKRFLTTKIDEQIANTDELGVPSEKFLALKLQKLAADSDIVLDLHTGPIACRYLYIGQYAKEMARDLKFPFNIIIPNEFDGAMDEACFVPWVKLVDELRSQKNYKGPYLFESYTVELGSEEIINSNEAKIDLNHILHFLSKRGVLNQDQSKLSFHAKQCIDGTLENYKSLYLKESALIEYLKGPGESVSKGEPLYRIYSLGHLNDQSVTVINSPLSGHIINHNPSCALRLGSLVYQILT